MQRLVHIHVLIVTLFDESGFLFISENNTTFNNDNVQIKSDTYWNDHSTQYS
jgi:hypothetical protein